MRAFSLLPAVLAACLGAVPAPGTAGADPLLKVLELRPPADRDAAWQAAGRPLVLILPDHLGLDARAAFHAQGLLEAGIGVVAIDLPAGPGEEGWGRLLPAAPHRPGAAGVMLDALVAELRRSAAAGRRIGVLGFGLGGEAALLAAQEAAMAGAPMRLAAHAALYPTCTGPRLPALRAASAPTTGAPVLAIIPHAGGAGDMPGGCVALFDGWEDRRDGALALLPFDSLGYAFDLWPAEALVPKPLPTAQAIDPLRFDVLRTRLARDLVLRFFEDALLPATAR